LARVTKRQRATQKEKLQLVLREARIKAGMRQVDLARQLAKPQSFVSKYESGERRLDILELRDVCHALGLGLEAFVRRLERAL
jgi:transcriptional regulator with XRE-family HTH domain